MKNGRWVLVMFVLVVAGALSAADANAAKNSTECPEGTVFVPAGQLVMVDANGDCFCGTFQDRYALCAGCFAPDTPIQMADGTWREVEKIQNGEYIYNPVTKKNERVRNLVIGPEPIPLIEFGYEGRTVKVSTTHPVLTASGIRQAQNLKMGDVIFDTEGGKHAITVLHEVPVTEGQYVVNIALDIEAGKDNLPTRHLISANGIVVGDWQLQEQGVKEAMQPAAAGANAPAKDLAGKPVQAAETSAVAVQ